MTHFYPFFSLRIRLILLVLLALILALAIMLYTAAETRQREAERVEDEALTLARLLSANQESTIEGARQLLIAVTQLRDVQSGEPAACSARLVELLKLYPDYNGFGVARPDGEVFCSTVPLAQPINASNRAWFQRVIQTRNFAVGDYQVGRTSGRAILVFSYPLLDAAGQLQAVVFAVIELGILNQLATETSLSEGAVLIEIDRNGTILDRFPDSEAWVGQALPEAPLVQAMLGRGEGVANRPYRVPQTGQQGFFEGHYSPIQDVSGQVVGGLAVIRDITRRKNMEAELDEIQHRLVESRERDRLQLGRELHDGPIQDLYGVAFGLEAFKETLDQVSLAQFRVVQTTMWQVISALRFISSELRPQTLTPFGLEKAILSHAERFQETHPELQVKLDLMPDGQILPEGMRLSLFRIYQELLNNAAQHARASQVWIRFTLDSEQVVLEVQDDGRGFEAPQRWIELARQGQLGLVETLERAEAIGGQMKVISAPGEGVLIRVTVPHPAGKESR